MKKILTVLMIIALALTMCACGKNCGKKPVKTTKKAKEMDIKKIDDYLYSITIDDYDYEIGIENTTENFKSGGCAAIQNGSLRGRNYDWSYDDQAYFVISTPKKNGRHAVLGVAGSIPELTADVVDTKKYNKSYDYLPFATLDGVNDAGLICNILVVPSGEAGITTGTNPAAKDLCATMINRYVLDYASTVDDAIKLLKYRNIYMPHTEKMDQEFHWMISDSKRTVVIEFVDNEMRVLEDENIVTNFYLYNFDKEGKVLPRLPEGIERYNIIKDGYDSTATKDGMMKMLKSIKFSKAYDTSIVPFWYSEYAEKELDSTMFGNPDISDGNMEKAGAYSEKIQTNIGKHNKGRNNGTWITVYSAVYDMKDKSLSIACQEKEKVHEFKLSK